MCTSLNQHPATGVAVHARPCCSYHFDLAGKLCPCKQLLPQESLSTLKFANRAKNIKNEAHVNEDLDQRTLLRK